MISTEIETSFMPWLMDKTMNQVNQLVLGRNLLDSIIRDVVNQRVENYDQLAETLRQVIEGGIEIGTSTGDILHGADEQFESGRGELIITAEENNNERGETNGSALQNGTRRNL